MIALSNREIAWLVWLGIGLIWILTQQQVREALWQCVKAFCAPPILRIVAAMLAYVGVCVLIMAAFHIWQWDNLKTTLLWTLTFALVTMLDVSRVSEDDAFYGKTVRDTISATAVLLFVAELESFSLIAELVVVPGMVILGLMLAIAQTRADLKDTRVVVESIASMAGFGLLAYGLMAIVARPDEFVTWGILREFAVPVMLSLLFLPFMYALSVYMVCDRMTVRLIFCIADESVRKYARAKAVFAFAGDLEAMRRWGRNVGAARPETRADVDLSIREVLELRRREQSPPNIPAELGWSPYSAKAFLEAEGLSTNDYHRSYDGLWHASSVREIDDDILPSTISYTVEGTKLAATRITLGLKVFITARENAEQKDAARQEFARMAGVLARAAVPDIDLVPISKAIKVGGGRIDAVAAIVVQVSRRNWKNANIRGYELVLRIVHPCHEESRDDVATVE